MDGFVQKQLILFRKIDRIKRKEKNHPSCNLAAITACRSGNSMAACLKRMKVEKCRGQKELQRSDLQSNLSRRWRIAQMTIFKMMYLQ